MHQAHGMQRTCIEINCIFDLQVWTNNSRKRYIDNKSGILNTIYSSLFDATPEVSIFMQRLLLARNYVFVYGKKDSTRVPG